MANIVPGARRTYTYIFPEDYKDYTNFLFVTIAVGISFSSTNLNEVLRWKLGNATGVLFQNLFTDTPTITISGTDAYNDERFLIYGLKD